MKAYELICRNWHRLPGVAKIRKGTCFFRILFLPAAMFLCLSGCGRGIEEITAEEMSIAQEEIQLREIPVDFPFYETEKFSLTLASSEGAAGEYVLLLCDDNGQLLQQIPCGRLTEPVTFSYDGIAYGSWRDLEIFSADSDRGLLFRWEDERFSEEPVQIPRYAEARGGAMLTVKEDEETQEKRIYLLNEYRGWAEEVRSWSLNRDSGMLRIEDCLRQQSLFEGNVILDEAGEPLNQEYFEYLFWRNRDLLWDYSADPTVYAWLSEVNAEGDGSSWHTAEYESRQAFLESCGYTGEEPTYQYYDRFQELQLELYLDEEAQKCYGIAYWNHINCDREGVASLYGFTVCNIGEMQWEEDFAFSWLSVETTRGSAEGEDQGNMEYTESGKPDYYLLQGPMDDCGVEYLGDLVEINFIYREDGTLFTRDYHHDARTFGSTLCGMDSFFDERERLVYETGYITHGSCEFFYFYEDEGEVPVYGLFLDYNGGYAAPSMVRFR